MDKKSSTDTYVKVRQPRVAVASDLKTAPAPPTTLLAPLMSKSRTSRKRVAGSRGRRSASTSLPPEMECTITVRHRFRYYASSSATNVNTTVGHLLIACGGIGTIANSTIASFASSVRVERLQIWSGVVTTGAVDAEVVWENVNVPQTRDESKQTSFPLGVTTSKVLNTTPPARALCAFWQNSSVASNVVFQITCQAGSVIDAHLEYTLGNNLSNYASAGFAAVAQNTVYYGRLDGIGGKFTPLGLPSTN